jgi:sec-independent protein translocase protein TatA
MIGSTEIIIVAVVVLVLFGGTAIPRFARSLGKARREFKEGLREGERESDEEGKDGGGKA